MDYKLFVMLQKLLLATSGHCVTRFSVEADITDKHRYFLGHYLTVSLPASADVAFQYGVIHHLQSEIFGTLDPTAAVGSTEELL